MVIQRAFTVTMLMLVLTAFSAYQPLAGAGEHPLIVVTFYSLKDDVEDVLCGVGTVYPLTPPGVDPHEYQLSPRDVEVLKRADLVVSTGHTHFELEIRELVLRGELKARLLDIVEDVPLAIQVNPVTGNPNYHMPIRDPYNYVSFILSLSRILAEVDPGRAECYYARAVELATSLLEKTSMLAGKFSGNVIVDKPHAQYLAAWLGFNVAIVLRFEEEAPISPELVERAVRLMRAGEVVAVFVTAPVEAPESRLLLDEASKLGIPVVEVASPLVAGSRKAIESLISEVQKIGNLTRDRVQQPSSETGLWSVFNYVAVAVLSFLLGFATCYLLVKVLVTKR